MFKKFLIYFSIFLCIIFSLNINSYANESEDTLKSLNINARSYVVFDRKSKQILVGKNEFNKVKMASTTKILTATVILENCNLDDIVTVSKKAAGTGGSRLGLHTNDKISVRNLLYGLLLCSGNDAAVALAEHTSGSVSAFADLMNEKAKSLGLKNSHFETPHGLDSDGHYTTAYELALITDYALQNKTFLNIVGTKNYTITINNYSKTLTNTNELLGSLNGVYGVKTGFTNGANRCLVTGCKRGDMDLICVVLGCDTKTFRGQDSTKLLNYCFDNFEYVNIEEKLTNALNTWKLNNSNFFNVEKGVNSNLDITFSSLKTPIIPINKSSISELNTKFLIQSELVAPVYKDTVLGSYGIFASDKLILSGNIIANNDIGKKKIKFYMKSLIKNYSNYLNEAI